MIAKINRLLQEYRQDQKEIKKQLAELEWAHIYHDSIRDIPELQSLALNVGRWAGNYSFLYVLKRILTDCKPSSILEFGLGESSKFISCLIRNGYLHSKHTVVEQSEAWKLQFLEKNEWNNNSQILIAELSTRTVHGHPVNAYNNIHDLVKDDYAFYLIDGPFGSAHYSRYDIVDFIDRIPAEQDFIVLLDDYHRAGEKETADAIRSTFKKRNISFHEAEYAGVKSQVVFVSEKYRFLTSI